MATPNAFERLSPNQEVEVYAGQHGDTKEGEGQADISEVLGYFNNRTYDHLLLEDVGLDTENEMTIQATIKAVRRQGGVAFMELVGANPNDKLQVVIAVPKDQRDQFAALELKRGSIVHVTGMLVRRPEEAIRADVAQNYFAEHEFQTTVEGIRPLVQPEKLDSALPWANLVENGLLTRENYGEIIRMPEFIRVMRLREDLKATFLSHFKGRGFTEFTVPSLTGSVAESGAEVFRVKGRDHNLALNQSPQQMKQIMAAMYGRVVAVGEFFRDDPSFTAHHLAEFTGLDAEIQLNYENKWQAMGQVMYELEQVVRAMVAIMGNHEQAFADNGAQPPELPETTFPIISYQDAMAIVRAENPEVTDFNRTAEGIIARKVKEATGSDFYFLVGFPSADKPFYTDIVEEDPTTSYSFDLIYRGVEISSGGLRINDANFLRQRLAEKGFTDVEQFADYLDNFERGSAQTGGFGMGLERFVANTLGGLNVRLATLFPKNAKMALG